ncbi:MAG: hypothetical protein ACREJC_18195 [Tepidisphaeraceae bacterium]
MRSRPRWWRDKQTIQPGVPIGGVDGKIASSMSNPDDSTTLVFVRDLMMGSKIRAAAGAGAAVRFVRSPDELVGGARLIVDLNQPGAIEAAIAWQAATAGQTIGFVSHVDQETIERARKAGIGQVLSRSEFTARLPELLAGL